MNGSASLRDQIIRHWNQFNNPYVQRSTELVDEGAIVDGPAKYGHVAEMLAARE